MESTPLNTSTGSLDYPTDEQGHDLSSTPCNIANPPTSSEEQHNDCLEGTPIRIENNTSGETTPSIQERTVQNKTSA